jgi:hypothetical protein
MSPLVKAGRMLRLLGWLFLASLLVIAFGYIIPLAHNGVAPTGTVLSKWGPQCAVMAVLTVGNLIAGARLKKEGARANVIAGWVLAVFSLEPISKPQNCLRRMQMAASWTKPRRLIG